jgi:hypothetical protein
MEIKLDDISLQAACNAYQWSSMDPDKRGAQVRAEYVSVITSFYTGLIAAAKNEQEREYLEAAAVRYRAGYLEKHADWLRARSRCASSMVTGGSNFNVIRNEKANDSEYKKSLEFSEWQERAQAAIFKGLREMRVQAAGGPLQILRNEIESAERLSAWYKEIRAQFRKESDPQKRIEILKTVTGLAGKDLADFVSRNYIDADGLPAFRMTNNNARIKAAKERMARLEKTESTPTSEKAFEGGRVVDNAEADRIQVFFNERPGPELYGKLKGRGFRWSPTAGAWQRYRTQDTRWAVEAIIGVKI